MMRVVHLVSSKEKDIETFPPLKSKDTSMLE